MFDKKQEGTSHLPVFICGIIYRLLRELVWQLLLLQTIILNNTCKKG